MSQITYDNKVTLVSQPDVARENKVIDDDMNEIKTAVNDNYSKITDLAGTELWTNSSPTSSFASQTIGITLTDYKYIEIYYSRFTGTKILCNKIPFSNSSIQTELNYSDYDNGARSWNRNATIDTTGIQFGNCSINGTTTNTGLIPYKIIGYK